MLRSDEFRGRWRLLIASAVGLSTGMTATLFYSLGAFIPPLQREFGWSRGDLSLAASWMTLAVFLTGALVGRLCDRHGAAWVAALSLTAYAIGLLLLAATVTHIEQFWFAYFVIAAVGVGSTPIVLIRPISTAFDRARGLAMGIVLTGAGIAGFWVPWLVTSVTQTHGWRAAYRTLAILALIVAPLVYLGFRSVASHAALTAIARPEEGLSVSEARRTSQYWLLTAMAFAMALGIAGVVVHLIPMLGDLGLPSLRAAQIASTVGLASVVGRLVVGALLDRYSAPRVALSVLSLAAIGILLLWGTQLEFAWLAAALLGLAAGAEIDLLAYATARYFGRRHYGSLYGWLYSVFALGYGFSPYVVGRLRDAAGSYDGALLSSAACMGVAAALALRLGPYRYAPTQARRSTT